MIPGTSSETKSVTCALRVRLGKRTANYVCVSGSGRGRPLWLGRAQASMWTSTFSRPAQQTTSFTANFPWRAWNPVGMENPQYGAVPTPCYCKLSMPVLADCKSMPAANISRFWDVRGPFGMQILQFLPGRQPLLDIRSFLSPLHKFPRFSPSMLRLQILQFRPGRCPPLNIPSFSFSSSLHNYLRVLHASFHQNVMDFLSLPPSTNSIQLTGHIHFHFPRFFFSFPIISFSSSPLSLNTISLSYLHPQHSNFNPFSPPFTHLPQSHPSPDLPTSKLCNSSHNHYIIHQHTLLKSYQLIYY